MTAPRLLLAALVATVLAVATISVAALVGDRSAAPRVASSATAAAAPDTEARTPRTGALAVLAAWDQRRSEAWADGDAAALADLYEPGSTAGRRDLAMLRAWRERGLRVTGLRMQVLDAEVIDTADARLVLRVTDRVAAARAVGRGLDATLPADRPTTRQITLVRHAEGWRVADVV
ncbi:hypothetical protein [Nocardioides dongkuii]|uniref:hypothetical protein n=1 Tax=Nocardioides dongkuii TaxID=2760089 RepID=UPI001877D652|nr:hypothetical protein [Nocardioides dongkuii]